MKLDKIGGVSLLLFAAGALAQVDTETDWKEGVVPPPPSFNKDKLIPIDMPPFVSLKFGVDPATLTISTEGILRYVMVASNASGSISAMYEGLRCATGEVKTYARYNSSGQWSLVSSPTWQRLNDNRPSQHALALANQGVCEGSVLASNTAAELVNRMNRISPIHAR